MTRIGLLIAVLTVGLMGTTASTCQKTDPNNPTNPVVAGVIDCAEAGVHNAAVHIIDDVASALATGDYVNGLVALVKQFGEGAVDCAVREVSDTASAHASMNQLEADKAKRAKAWLDSRGATFAQADAKPWQITWTIRVALPFEHFDATLHARTDSGGALPLRCASAEHDVSPYAPGLACATNDYTFNDDKARTLLAGICIGCGLDIN